MPAGWGLSMKDFGHFLDLAVAHKAVEASLAPEAHPALWASAFERIYAEGRADARRKMPKQKPGESKQDYETSADFLAAVTAAFGPMAVDLACHVETAKAPLYYAAEVCDSLASPWVDWCGDVNYWLNPPYNDIGKWAAKCAAESKKLVNGAIFFLVPASIGARWFTEHVKPHALVLALQPRLTFVGMSHPFPKDCILAVYRPGLAGFDVWRWKD